MIMSDLVIGASGATQRDDGIAIELRLPWYRSLPLSTIEVGGLEIDGTPVDLTAAVLELEDRRYPLDQIEEQTGHVWYVLDSAWLHVPGVELADGGEHEIAATLVLYPPYIRGLRRPVRQVVRQIVTKEPAHV